MKCRGSSFRQEVSQNGCAIIRHLLEKYQVDLSGNFRDTPAFLSIRSESLPDQNATEMMLNAAVATTQNQVEST